jgi:large subunit ribosomal protein L24
MFYCSSCAKPVRIGYRYTSDGSKERFCKSCGASQGTISPPREKYAKK